MRGVLGRPPRNAAVRARLGRALAGTPRDFTLNSINPIQEADMAQQRTDIDVVDETN
ncbi:MAG: hypothetical protein ACRDTC_14765 [Pseudonocardiaceae bacterium]